MGKIKDLIDLLEDFEVEVDVILGEDDEPEEEKKPEEPVPDMEKETEEKLNKLRKEVTDHYGEKHANMVEEAAVMGAIIEQMIRHGIPLDKAAVEKYNELCFGVFPQYKDELLLGMMYKAIDHIVRKRGDE